MTLKLARSKRRLWYKSLLYRMKKLPLSAKTKLKMFLNLEYMFERLAWETSWSVFPAEEHPLRVLNRKFLMNCLLPEYSVLDLGCKAGYDAYLVAGKCHKVVGIDYDAREIEFAKKNYQRPNLEFHAVEGISYLTESPHQFDVLVLSHVLEHLDEPLDFLRKFRIFFRFVYIEVPDFDRTVLNHFRQRLGVELIYSDDDHISEFDRYDLQNVIEESGLEVIRTEYFLGNMKFWCRNPSTEEAQVSST